MSESKTLAEIGAAMERERRRKEACWRADHYQARATRFAESGDEHASMEWERNALDAEYEAERLAREQEAHWP